MRAFADRVSGFNRRRKLELFLRLVDVKIAVRILDVGYTDREYSEVENLLEKRYPHRERIVALGPGQPVYFHRRYPEVTVVRYDGRRFPFRDGAFDVVWSNAVIEHVGGREEQLTVLREMRRVGKAGFITTPNRYFPVEVHTKTPLLHFFPKSWFDRYLRLVGQDWATGDYVHLLSRRDLRALLEAAGVTHYRIRGNRIGPFTLDFVVTWGIGD